MKRIISSLFACAVSTVLLAQIPFEVTDPQWTFIAFPLDSDGVNIRKFPSTTAPRTLVDWAKVDNFQTPLNYYAYWSTATPKGEVEPLLFTGTAPVLSEKNGWYEIEGIGPKGENGWVSAKLCKIVTPKIYTAADFENDPYSRVITKDGGTYIFKMQPDLMDGYVYFTLGKLSDGYLINVYDLFAESYETGQQTQLIKNGDVFTYRTQKKYTDEEGCPVLKGVPQSVVDNIMSNMKKMPKSAILYNYEYQY